MFRDVSVVMPVLNEVESLRLSLRILRQSCSGALNEVILVIGERTTEAARQACEASVKAWPDRVKIVFQSLPFLGGALRSGITAATGSHIAFLFSDLESDPKSLESMIELARKNANHVVIASRWLPGATFQNYGQLKWFLNLTFQGVCRILFRSAATDYTFGYRLYPAEVLKGRNWVEERHAFVLESLLSPIVSGVSICEVPTSWTRRSEGEATGTFRVYFSYFRVIGRWFWIRATRREGSGSERSDSSSNRSSDSSFGRSNDRGQDKGR